MGLSRVKLSQQSESIREALGITAPSVDAGEGATSSTFLRGDGEFTEPTVTLPNLGITSSAAELNTLDGYTGNVNDLNILSGAAAGGLTAAELLYVKNVTSDIQTQLDAKQATLTGLTASVAELNFTDGVTSNIQTQLDAKQASDATLTSLAALGTAADKMAYTTGVDTWAETALTAFGRSILDDADEATFKATVNLEIGTDVQAYSENLDEYAAVNPTAAGLALLDDVDAAAQRTTLGLGTIATQAANNVSISGGSITGITDLAVADGGTGKSAWTQYLIPYADTTTSFSQIAIGTLGQVLTSNGAGAAPTFQDAAAGSGDVVGPASSTDNAIARFDSTTGKLLQNSGVVIGDSNDITLTIANSANVVGLTINQNDNTNDRAAIHTINNTSAGYSAIFENIISSGVGANMQFYKNSVSPATTDNITNFDFYSNNASAVKKLMAQITLNHQTSVTAGSEGMSYSFYAIVGGAITDLMDMGDSAGSPYVGFNEYTYFSGPTEFYDTISAFSSLILDSSPPASAAAAGVAGTITWDASFIYICTATNTWKRVAIATW